MSLRFLCKNSSWKAIHKTFTSASLACTWLHIRVTSS